MGAAAPSTTWSTRCFNYPTLSESYKVAALDATNKMRAVNMFANGDVDEPPAADGRVAEPVASG